MSNVLSMYNSKYTHLRTNAVNERMKWRKELRNSLAIDLNTLPQSALSDKIAELVELMDKREWEESRNRCNPFTSLQCHGKEKQI